MAIDPEAAVAKSVLLQRIPKQDYKRSDDDRAVGCLLILIFIPFSLIKR